MFIKLITTLGLLFSLNALANPLCLEEFDPRLQRVISELESIGWQPQNGNGEPGSWKIDGTNSLGRYDSSLASVISLVDPNLKGLSNLVLSRPDGNFLELFGSGFVADPGMVKSRTGIRWESFGSADETNPPREVLGDIMNPETWTSLDSPEAIKYDVVVMNPVGGWAFPYVNSARDNLIALEFVLVNVVDRLSDQGVFVFNIEFHKLKPVLSTTAFDGDIRNDSYFRTLIESFEDHPTHRLTIEPRISRPIDIGGGRQLPGSTYDLYGALVPK